MKIIEEQEFAKMLKAGICDNLFFIFGNDDYLKEYYCNRLVSSTVDESMKMFNLHTYQDLSADIDEIFADADNLPMMADKLCLLIRNYPLHELGKDALKELEKHLADIPPTTVMIFFFNTLEVTYTPKKQSKWNAVTEIFAKYGNVVRLDHRSPAKMAQMLVAKAKEKGTSIDPAQAKYLIDCVGDDMQTIVNEFNKVCAFSCGEKITNEMIDMTAVKCVEASVFDISSAIFNGDPDRAFEIVNELIRLKTPVQSIIGALASSYVNMYRYKVALNADKGYSDFKSDFGYGENPSYIFNKISAFTRKISISVIRRSIDILSEADVRSKSSKINEQILLTETVAKLADCIR